jgi:hypothetical protein
MNELVLNFSRLTVSPICSIPIYRQIDPFFLESKIITFQNLWRNHKKNVIIPKGKMCSISGNNYELDIFNIVNKCKLNDILFNTQTKEELGGSTASNDIECNFKSIKDIGIEVKKYNTPDFMQCSLTYDKKNKKLVPSKKGKIPKECKEIFESIFQDINLYNGDIPPFLEKKITHDEWKSIKNSTNKWNDCYFDIPNDTIKKLYNKKGCSYIQISDGYGLYHLGNDICNFNVPEFNIEQQLRVRTKIHTKKNKKGFCNISVTAACQPKKIESIEKSTYSLDDINKLPINLIYSNQ